jgi:hypothetical protein
MKLGFNSNVECRGAVYHVQTETLGAHHPVVDTVVVFEGRVLHHTSFSYADLLAAGAPDDPVELSARVERQHREISDALASGALELDTSSPDTAIEVKLRNAASWLSGGIAALDIEVRSRHGGAPAVGAELEVLFEGSGVNEQPVWKAQTNAGGLAELRFPLPSFATDALPELVIRAKTAHGRDQLRYRLKAAGSKAVEPAPKPR